MRIGVISVTLNAVNPIVRFLQAYDEIEYFNYLDSGLIDRVNRDGYISEASMDRMKILFHTAKNDDVDGVLLTCTAFSPYADDFSEVLGIPVIAPDNAMIELAVESGEKTAVLYTFPSTRTSTETLIKSTEAKLQRKLEYDLVFVEDAFDELQAGRYEVHDRLISDKISEIDGRYGLILLAQISMAGVVSKVESRTKVLVSPDSALGELRKRLKAEG